MHRLTQLICLTPVPCVRGDPHININKEILGIVITFWEELTLANARGPA